MKHDDFAFEPRPGLPAELPEGETLVWQGAPDWRGLAWRVFHLREVAIYFAVLIGWTAFSTAWMHGSAKAVLIALGPVTLAGAISCGLLAFLAWLSAKTTVYSITSERLVMRIGIALPITFNLPFSVIDSAAVRQMADGSGDISLKLAAGNRLAYLVLWPHARPWRVRNPEPSLRALADVAGVSRILSRALASKAPADAVFAPLPTRSGSTGNTTPAGLPDSAEPAH